MEALANTIQSTLELEGSSATTMEKVKKTLTEEIIIGICSPIVDMLQNIAYTGRIVIPANNDEIESIIIGLHEPIISCSLFAEVQSILSGRKKSYKGNTKNTETPLVGHLYCSECDKPMTGSGSKSGGGNIYHYYHCQRKYGCRNAISAKLANEKFNDYISSFQPDLEMLEAYNKILNDVFNSNGYDRENEKVNLKTQIDSINRNINDAAMKNLTANDLWDDETFKRTKDLLVGQKNELIAKLNRLNKLVPEFSSYLSNTTSLLTNLNVFYKKVDCESKKKLISSIFPEKIYFENDSYRTTKTNEVIEVIFSTGKGLKENCLANNARQSSEAPPSGLEPETL